MSKKRSSIELTTVAQKNRNRRVDIIDKWLNTFPCKKYWKYPDAGCIHEHVSAEDLYAFIEGKIHGI